jgi:hypothetical protein
MHAMYTIVETVVGGVVLAALLGASGWLWKRYAAIREENRKLREQLVSRVRSSFTNTSDLVED